MLYISETLELLKAIRAEVHDDVDEIVIEQLDYAIWMLQESQQNQIVKLSLQDVLVILGTALKALPAIAELIGSFQDCQ